MTAAGAIETPFPPAPVEELLRTFSKAVRAHQLYLPNNPVYKSAIESVRAAFAPVWQHTDELAIRFSETQITWSGHPVLSEDTKGADSLPWTFFKDGIREIRITQGFEHEELVKLFDILHRVRKAAPDEDDLLTMLWEADFASLQYRYVDLGAEPVAPLAESEGQLQQPSPDAVSAAAREPLEEARAAVVNMQDFDATLYFLDEKELDYLRREIEREYATDLRLNVLTILLDIYESQPAPEVRDEVTSLIENMMLLFLAAGQFRPVAYLLAETQVVAKRAFAITPEQQERLRILSDRLSEPEPLGQMLLALDEAADRPPQDELGALFEQLQGSALGTVLAWLKRIQNTDVKLLVEQAADRLASANTPELVRLIQSPQRDVAHEAIRRAAALKSPASVAPMARLLVDNNDAELRLVAVQALATIGTPGAYQALERSIQDADREVRVTAVRTLSAKAYRGMFNRLESAVKGKELREADLTEKMAFFEAYGAMCGEGGVAFLDGILNGKSLFGGREDPELRACAAIALGRVGSKRAQEALQKAAGEKDIVVRNAVSRAMRSGTP